MTKVARKQLERVVPLMLFHSIANGLGIMNGWSIKPKCHWVRGKPSSLFHELFTLEKEWWNKV